MNTIKLCLILATFIVIGSCAMQQEVNVQAEKELIQQTIDDCIKWPFPEKNVERLYSSLAKDAEFFIFHPDAASTIVGYEAFDETIKTVFLSDDLVATRTEMSDMRINLSRAGDVAWFNCILQDEGTWQGKKYEWKDCRWTGVLEKRDGKWLIVQMHFSFASDAKSGS